MRYATFSSGAWTVETVDSHSFEGHMTSIALHDGSPEIIYLRRDNAKYFLYHATRSADAWSSNPIASTFTAPQPIHLAVESKGQRHIFYNDGSLQERRQVGVNWPETTVADEGFSSSIALGKDDVIHLAFHDLSDGDLLYANNRDDAWKPADVDVEGNTGTVSSTAVDANGRVHIVYRDIDRKMLRYAFTCP